MAILQPELGNEFFMELAKALEARLKAEGYTLIKSSSSNSVAEEERRLQLLTRHLVDGIVVIPAGNRGRHLRKTAKSGTSQLSAAR